MNVQIIDSVYRATEEKSVNNTPLMTPLNNCDTLLSRYKYHDSLSNPSRASVSMDPYIDEFVIERQYPGWPRERGLKFENITEFSLLMFLKLIEILITFQVPFLSAPVSDQRKLLEALVRVMHLKEGLYPFLYPSLRELDPDYHWNRVRDEWIGTNMQPKLTKAQIQSTIDREYSQYQNTLNYEDWEKPLSLSQLSLHGKLSFYEYLIRKTTNLAPLFFHLGLDKLKGDHPAFQTAIHLISLRRFKKPESLNQMRVAIEARQRFSRHHSKLSCRLIELIQIHFCRGQDPGPFRKLFFMKFHQANNSLERKFQGNGRNYAKFLGDFTDPLISRFASEYVRGFPFQVIPTKVYFGICKDNYEVKQKFNELISSSDSSDIDADVTSVNSQAWYHLNTMSVKVGLDEQATTTIEKAVEASSEIADKLSRPIDDLTGLLKNFLAPDNPIFTKIVLICGNFFNLLKTDDNAIRASCLTQLAFIIYPHNTAVLTGCLAPLLAYLPKVVYPVETRVLSQSGRESLHASEEQVVVRKSIITICYYFLKNIIGLENEPSYTLPRLSNMLRNYDIGITSMKSLFEYAVSVIHYMSDYFGYALDSTWNLSPFASSLVKDVRRWCEESTPQLNEEVSSILRSSEKRTLFEHFKSSGDALLKRMTCTYIPRAHLQSFYKIYEQIKSKAEAVFRHKVSEEIRDEPIGVWFHGDTDVGKSTLLDFIMCSICDRQNIRWDHLMRYERKAGQPFWDGYNNQMFVTMDDVFQSDLALVNAPSALEVIYAINCNTYPLNMAPLEQKGTVYFTSKYVFLTSNIATLPTTASLTCHPAFYRRFREHRYRVTLKKTVSDVLDLEAWERSWSFTNDLNEVFTFEQVVDRILGQQPISRKSVLEALRERNMKRTEAKVSSQSSTPPNFPKSRLEEYPDEALDIVVGQCLNIDKFKRILPLLGFTAFLATTGFALYKIFFSKTKSSHNETFQPAFHNAMYFESGEARTTHAPSHSVVLQQMPNANNINVIRTVLPGNMFRITNGDGGCVTGVFLRGRTFVTVAHIFATSKKGHRIFIEFSNNRNYSLLFDDLKLMKVKDMDLIFVTCPDIVPSARDITNHLCSMKDYAGNMTDQVKLLTFTPTTTFVNSIESGCTRDTIRSEQEMILTRDALVFKGNTQSGDCGSLYCSVVDNSPTIFGLHVANDKVGHIFAVPLCRDMVQEYCKDENPVQCVFSQCNMKRSFLKAPVGTEPLGTIDKTLRHFIPASTTIRPSSLHGILSEPVTGPASMRTENGISPLQLAINKNTKPSIRIDPKLLEEASKYLLPLIGIPPRSRRVVLTTQQAINGSPEFLYTQKIEMRTSAGFPYVKENLGKGKSHLFQLIDGIYHPCPLLTTRIESRLLGYSQGTCPPTLWLDNLKDERRTLEKVANKSTRTFVCPPVDFTIVSRRYLQTFVDHLMTNHLFFDCSVGINPHSREWGLLYSRLRSVSKDEPFWIAGDFSAFDSSIPAQVGWKIMDIIDRWYNDGNTLIRKSIFTDVISAVHCSHDVLYRVDKGNPSGMPLTSIFNSLANTILLRICWVIITQLLKCGLGVGDFDKYVRVAVFGDDNVVAVHPSCPWYNMVSISQAMTMVGMTYTDSRKETSSRPFVPFSEVTFLKRSFRKVGADVFAPLEESSILEMINWVRNTVPTNEATRINCENGVREYFHYGEDVFESKKTLINTELSKLGLKPITLEYSKLYSEFQDMGFINPSEMTLNYKHETMNYKDDICWPSSDNFHFEDPYTVVQAQSSIVHSDPSVSDTISINREEAQEHRAPIDTSIAITSFGDDVAKDIDALPLSTKGVIFHDPYPDQNLATVLSRVYRVAEPIWTPSQIPGQNLVTLRFPQALFRERNIREKLHKFQFFRADVKISIRVNGTAFCYGKLLVIWLPSIDTIPGPSLLRLSQNPHVIISANTNETQEFTIPYVSAYQFLNLGFYSGNLATYRGFFGCVQVHVLNPLRSSNSLEIAPLYVSVYASFVDPKVAGPTTTIYDLTPPLVVTSQGKPTTNEAQQQNSVDSLVGPVARSLGTYLRTIPVVGPLMSGIRFGLQYMGFDKPSSVALRQFTDLNLARGFAHGDGMDFCNKLSICADNQVANGVEIYRQERDEMDFAYLLSLPTLIATFSVSADDPSGSILFQIPVNPCYGPPGPISVDVSRLTFISNYFTYWRGSLNYAVQIAAGSFTSCRLRVSWHPNYTDIPTTLADGEGDYISHVIDVTGDTLYKFSIPYLQSALFQRVSFPSLTTAIDTTNGVLMFSVVNPVRTTDSVITNSIYVNVWNAAGPGFELALPRVPNWLVTSQYSMREEFLKNDFEPLIPASEILIDGVMMGEKISSLRTLLHRYSDFAFPPSRLITILDVQTIQRDIMQMFLFSRGSVRIREFKVAPTTSEQSYMAHYYPASAHQPTSTSYFCFNGLNYTNSEYKPALETEIPYYSRYIMAYNSAGNRFGQTTPYQPLTVFPVAIEDTSRRFFLAWGDDFTVGWARAPPVVFIVPPT